MLKTIRNHFSRAINNRHNSLINGITIQTDTYIDKARQNGYIPPEVFIFLDKKGYIQNENNIPIIYQNTRRKKQETSLKYEPKLINHNQLIFSTNIPKGDCTVKAIISRSNNKYPWVE